MKQRVLFLSVGFHNYDQAIIAELGKHCEVDYINTFDYYNRHLRLFQASYYVKMQHLLFRLISRHIQRELLSRRDKSYDTIFIIKGQFLDRRNMQTLVSQWPGARRVLYLWDVWERHYNRKLLKQYFTDIWSFDPEDCARLGFRFRPTFHLSGGEPADDRPAPLYGLSFVGQYYPHRIAWLRQLREWCRSEGIASRFVLVPSHRVQYLLERLLGRIRRTDRDMVSLRPLPYEEYIAVTERSACVADIPFRGQNGLTIRTLETIALGRGLVTTNPTIEHCPDIDARSWFLCSAESLRDGSLARFVERAAREGVPSLPQRYTLQAFLSEILNG